MISHATKENGGKALSAGQQEDVLLAYLKNLAPKGFHQPAVTKGRQIESITKEIEHHYENPFDAGMRRIDRHVHAISKRRLFSPP